MADGAELELGFFLHSSFPLRTEEELREETFFLLYSTDGAFGFSDIWGDSMSRSDRDWMVRRTLEQKKAEKIQREIDAAAHKTK